MSKVVSEYSVPMATGSVFYGAPNPQTFTPVTFVDAKVTSHPFIKGDKSPRLCDLTKRMSNLEALVGPLKYSIAYLATQLIPNWMPPVPDKPDGRNFYPQNEALIKWMNEYFDKSVFEALLYPYTETTTKLYLIEFVSDAVITHMAGKQVRLVPDTTDSAFVLYNALVYDLIEQPEETKSEPDKVTDNSELVTKTETSTEAPVTEKN